MTPSPEVPGRVLVTHPGRQHSHQAALALAGDDLLAGYWAGVPSSPAHRRGVPGPLWRRFIRYSPVDLPADTPLGVRWRPLTPAVRRASGALLPETLAYEADYLACRGFDRWVARGVERARLRGDAPAAVLACEISARDAFHAAETAGVRKLLDAPSFHHHAQDRLHGFRESPGLHRRITTVKDEEIAAADAVLVVSELARRTYLEAGVPEHKVHAVPLGADLDLFRPREDGEPRPAGAPARFVFVGARILRKGFDLLCDAWPEVVRAVAEAGGPPPELRLVGPGGDAEGSLTEIHRRSGVTVVGAVPQAGLAEELRRADALVLPSRNDSYGMVVAEALACGTPVVVSTQTGSGELVTEGDNGWVVPVTGTDAAADISALTRRLTALALDPATLRARREAARTSALASTWEAYHRRFAGLVRRLIAP
jgi:glycosyltransferase involved in cell wall biosynthesis